LTQARRFGPTIWDVLESPAPSRHPTCPRCQGRKHLHVADARIRCAECRYQIAHLTPDQLQVIQDALAERPILLSLPSYLAELALLQRRITPIGYPR
jgi:hypothetical protein